MSDDVRENLTYDGFGHAVRELAQAVADDGYEPDVVLSIARGGVFVAAWAGVRAGLQEHSSGECGVLHGGGHHA